MADHSKKRVQLPKNHAPEHTIFQQADWLTLSPALKGNEDAALLSPVLQNEANECATPLPPASQPEDDEFVMSVPPVSPHEIDESEKIQLISSRSEQGSPYEPELGPLPPVYLQFVRRCLRENEHGDALLFVHLFLDRCAHDASADAWYVWLEQYWEEDWRNYPRLLVCGTLANIYQKASILLSEQPLKKPMSEHTSSQSVVTLDDKQQQHEASSEDERRKERIALNNRIKQLKTLARTEHVLSYAKTLLAVESKVWDANPWLLGTKQGVIDLRTGTLRPGRPDDYIRTIIPTEWKGLDEPAPRFEQFLSEIFADREETERDELIAFLQRALGYGITGQVNEHIFLMLYGEEGRNGKDTLMHVLGHVLGNAAGAISQDVLLARGRASTPGSATPHLCGLQGKRIAWASEPGSQARFAIDQIKLLTGGGDFVARQLYARERTFKPSHLLILLSNHKPEADASDHAFWERLCPIIFNLRFVEKPERANERACDTRLARDLEAEASGILAWLVRGTLEWHRLGLAIPESVRQARREYRRSESTIKDFVRDRCMLDAEAQTSAGTLHKAYREWTSANGLKPVSNKQFAQEMKQVEGVVCNHTKQGNLYIGMGLKPESEEIN